MDGYTVSDDVGNAAAVIGEENNDDAAIDSLEVEPELLDTSRLARGEYTQSIARKITEQQEVGVMMPSVSASVSFEPCPRSTSEVSASVRKELFQENSQGGSGLIQSTLSSDDVPPQTPQQDQSIAVPNSTNSSKSALDSLSEYITFFFKNVENYEEMLERSASQRDLNASLDRQRYGSPIFSSPEGGDDDDGDDVDLAGIAIQQQHDNNEHTDMQQRASTPNLVLSDSQEAMAAVEAISNFRSLREVKREIMDRGTPIRKDSENSKKPRIDVCQDSTDFDIRQSWDNFCAEKKSNKFSELGLESIPIPVSVDDFYKLVLEDKADHSIEKFMRDIGELEVESTLWVPSSPNTSNSMNRTIQYIHPINAPMAPPTAQARKEQSLTKFGNVGLCLETCTFVENVPMADCFVVKDRLWINRNPVDQGGCIMSITFQIDFIKGTMFRRIIENTTRGEYEKYWGQFWNMIQSNLGSSDSSNELAEVAMELEEAALLLESEGQEVPLSSVLGRIRRTSRRLSVAARRASARDVHGTAGKMESSTLLIIVRKGKVVVLEIVTIIKQHLKQHFAEKDDSYVLGCLLIFLLGMFNIMAMWQISVMNRSIALLTNQINQAMLTNMGSGENCLVK